MLASLLLPLLAVATISLQVSPPTQQNPVVAPPVPILDISSKFISKAVSKLIPRDFNDNVFGKRDGPETCGPNSPCADKSCCSKSGICGYGPTYCGNGNCTSNCNALAMCGRYSERGNISCGMGLCCSYYGWCGTDSIHCGNPDPHGQTPCQAGFGQCAIVPPPSCSSSGGSVNGRSIGYYQASNTRDRICNKVSPSQIILNGFTHLYFAFAKFDPSSYQIVPGNAGDVSLYTDFNNLQAKGVKTWIAIGGFDFSDPGTSTFTAWSNMTSTAANRAAFISSLKSFMAQYKFQGVDLDWEYPGTPERGGQRADTANLVSLVKEMRASFGSTYGISLTLAPDYWYLRYFDAKAMESSVDWFGFMAYDLHGYWDASNPNIGPYVKAQTDLNDIRNDTLPLWFDYLDPKKINFGLAYYGRGFTLQDPSCNTLGCPYTGPSKPGPCTNFAGVMSLREIQQLIAQRKLTPKLLQGSAVKQITFDDQIILYDDADTIALKKQFANSQCFGGSMTWSVDFNGTGSGDVPPNSTDGSCGPSKGGAVCTFWPGGNCCSNSGWCGKGDQYCGSSNCQSGNCTIGGVTSDGTCGVQHNNATCGNWAQGSCCSSAGYCGNTTAHCGTGCQSGCSGKPPASSGSPGSTKPPAYSPSGATGTPVSTRPIDSGGLTPPSSPTPTPSLVAVCVTAHSMNFNNANPGGTHGVGLQVWKQGTLICDWQNSTGTFSGSSSSVYKGDCQDGRTSFTFTNNGRSVRIGSTGTDPTSSSWIQLPVIKSSESDSDSDFDYNNKCGQLRCVDHEYAFASTTDVCNSKGCGLPSLCYNNKCGDYDPTCKTA